MTNRNVKPTPAPPRAVFVLRLGQDIERVLVQVVDFYPARQIRGRPSNGQATRH